LPSCMGNSFWQQVSGRSGRKWPDRTMAFWIYWSETIPNPESFGKPGYTPEWFVWGGVQLPVLNKGEWTRLSDSFYNMRHRDWRDKSGGREHNPAGGVTKDLTGRGGRRGVGVPVHEAAGGGETASL